MSAVYFKTLIDRQKELLKQNDESISLLLKK